MAATKTKQRFDPQALGLVPVDDEKPKRGTPEDLGLVALQDEEDTSPEALGLEPLDATPQTPEAPEEEDWIDWATHKGRQFVDTLTSTFGLDPAPEAANADMSVVEEAPQPPRMGDIAPGKITPEGGVLDWLVPDPIEQPIRGAYDFVTSPRTMRNLEAGAYSSGQNLMRLSKNAVGLVNYVNDFLTEETGIGVDSSKAELPFSDQTWDEFQQDLGRAQQWYEQKYATTRLPDEERGVVDVLTEVVPQLPAMIAEYGSAAKALGPIAGFASVDALMHADEGVESAAWAGVKGAALGAFFEWANILSRPLRVPALAAAGGGVTAAEGGSDSEIAAHAILFPVLGLPARGGPIGARYIREHGVLADVREFGAHVRDLMVGGNVQRSKVDAESAAQKLQAIRQRHQQEVQEEQAKVAVEVSSAREPRPGEMTPTQAEVDSRISRVQQDAQDRMEALRTRQMKAETEARHEYETAARRYNRALHPFRTSFAIAPHARALQSAERKVLVENQRGYEQVQSANRAAEERFTAARTEAERLRNEPAQTPEERAKNLDLADYIEAEGGRVAFEMRRRVEDAVEQRIARAEDAAGRARQALAIKLGVRNKIEGRRARLMATDRDVQEASRAGIRRLNRGNSRARMLIRMGDEHVSRVQRRLGESGIKKEDPAYEDAMARANDVREQYREMASNELLNAQYAADSQVSRAQSRRDLAVRAAEAAGVSPERLSRTEAKRDPRRRSQEDEWDLPDDIDARRGPEYEHAYRQALESSKKDPMIAEIAKNVDPILERIQDPADVLPAINRIAKQMEHDSPSRRGKQTGEKREVLAEQLGLSEKELLETPYGKAFSDYEIEASLMLLRRQWRRVQDAYRDWRNDRGSKLKGDRARLELMRLLMIVERLKGVAAEAGRSLRMFRELKKEFGGINDILSDRNLDRVMTLDTPGKVAKVTEKILRGDWMGALTEYWINMLLSSPQTAFVNFYSGAGMAAYKPIESAVAATIGMTRWAVWNAVGRPLTAPLRWLFRAMARAGVFGEDYRIRANARRLEDQARSAYPRYPREFPARDRIRFGEVGARIRGYWEALSSLSQSNAFYTAMRTLFGGERYLNESNFTGAQQHIPGVLGKVIRLPGTVLAAIDDFFKAMAFRAGVRAHAYRKAVAESENLDWSNPFKAKREVRKRYRELVDNPSGDILAEARREALEATFQQESKTAVGDAVGLLRRQLPASAFVIPFHRVLLNSVEWFIRGTPLAPLYKRWRMDAFGYNGRAKQDEALARILIVSGSALAVYFYALNGNVRPNYSQDQKGKTIQGIAGPPPMSIRVPGTNQWVSVNRVDPIGAIVALGGAAAEVTKNASAQGDADATERAMSTVVQATANMALSRAGMMGLVDMLEALQGGSYGNDINSFNRWAEKLGATITVPQAVATVARTQDPYMRFANSYVEQVMARTPGQREKLWPVRNLWGSPIKGYDSYGEGPVGDTLDMTQPFYWGALSKDPASRAMIELYETYRWAPGQLQRIIKGRKLTDEEYDFYASQAGRNAYAKVRELTGGAEYAQVKKLEAEYRRLDDILWKGKAKGQEWRQEEYKAVQAQRDRVEEELRKARLGFLEDVKKVIRSARKDARLATVGREDGSVPGRFGKDFWARPKQRDLDRVSGAPPQWLDAINRFMDAESPTEEADAQEVEDSYDDDPSISDVERREREQNQRLWDQAGKRLNPARP